MNAVATSMSSRGGWSRRVRRDVLTRALGSAPRFAVVSGGNMSPLNRVVRQATRLAPLNRTIEMVVFGENDPTWLQHTIGFKNLRNVRYDLAAARWARLIEEDAIRSTSLGHRYVSSRLLEGVHGSAIFEEIMRVTGDDVPTPDVVASVLRRWSFRYSKRTVTLHSWSRRTCRPSTASPRSGRPCRLTPVKGIRRSKNTSRDEATDAKLCLPLKENG